MRPVPNTPPRLSVVKRCLFSRQMPTINSVTVMTAVTTAATSAGPHKERPIQGNRRRRSRIHVARPPLRVIRALSVIHSRRVGIGRDIGAAPDQLVQVLAFPGAGG